VTPPATRRRRLSAEQRRASIIAAATEVFAEAGYRRATMAEVARRVGVSEPVVFQNFGSKAAVFAAAVEDATSRMTATMHERATASGTIGAWLAELLTPGHPGGAHPPGPHHVLFADAMAQPTEPLVSEAIREAHHTVAEMLAGLLARGQADGSVRPDLDPRVGAWWLLSHLAARGFRAAAMPDHDHLEAQLGAMILHALTTD
jgi:AcrR family transcriptional regulator